MYDLHIHTTASDGFASPEAVVSFAHSNGVRGIAITDHNTIDGIVAATEAGEKKGVEIIPGIEFSADFNGISIHIVGLFINPNELSLSVNLDDLKALRAVRNHYIVGVLVGMGLSLTMENIRSLLDLNVGSRTLYIHHMKKIGLINPNDNDLIQNIRAKLKTANFLKRKRSAKDAIAHIHKAGGIAILAHPFDYEMTWDDIEIMIAELVNYKLDGLEAYYYDNNEEQQAKLITVAKKHGLALSGGSDFHDYDDREIGKGLYCSLVPDNVFENLKSKASRSAKKSGE